MLSYQSYTNIITTEGSGYIRKLCRHFSHKITATYTENSGEAHFPTAHCKMSCTKSQLSFFLTGTSADDLLKAEYVIVRHLVKFAFRENLKIDWKRSEQNTVS